MSSQPTLLLHKVFGRDAFLQSSTLGAVAAVVRRRRAENHASTVSRVALGVGAVEADVSGGE